VSQLDKGNLRVFENKIHKKSHNCAGGESNYYHSSSWRKFESTHFDLLIPLTYIIANYFFPQVISEYNSAIAACRHEEGEL
jgi:hypothetical protein